MTRRAKQLVLSALTSIVATTSLAVATAPQASAINEVTCGVRTDLALVYGHKFSDGDVDSSWCYANAGEIRWSGGYYLGWAHQISTGNNVVQWHGDGRWQPDTPIGKWAIYTWPNYPGGIRIDGLKIY
ncbi:beta/gamma crystallin domain-containing protein [Streptomyces longwoodensis]|uniref:beta/gamma crystallin domain-containing protein n=1 Tax=Streptomyces longwoodensis TaxID=68231 RepID=UPI0030E595C7